MRYTHRRHPDHLRLEGLRAPRAGPRRAPGRPAAGGRRDRGRQAEGTDYGGSIRVPAAACGVVGLKPSPGRVARQAPNPWDSIGVSGPLARTVRDVALAFGVLCGPDARDPISLPETGEDFLAACDAPLGKLRVAWSPDLGYAAVEPPVLAVAAAAARAFADLGCTVEDADPGFEDPGELLMALGGVKYAVSLGPYLAEWSDLLDPEIRHFIHAAEGLTAADYERLSEQRADLWRRTSRFFERYDLLLTPATAVLPFPVDAPFPPPTVADRPLTYQLNLFPFGYPFNLTGNSALVLPAGWTEDGLPVGLQLVARGNAEATLLRAAAAFEAVRPWATRWPAV